MRALLIAGVLSVAGCASVQPAPTARPGGERARLRQQLASEFLEPKPHLQLARYLKEQGQWLSAFYVSEAARRGRFKREVFDKAFVEWMDLPTAPEPDPKVESINQAMIPLIKSDPRAAIAKLKAALKDHPKSALLRGNLAICYYRLEETGPARKHFEAAAALAPETGAIQGRVGRFLLKGAKDPEAALPYYLRAYFGNPHYYDGEYAEGRIRSIAWAQGHQRAERLHRSGHGLDAIAGDAHPVTAGVALKKIAELWEDRYVEACLSAMRRDDPNLRWQATSILLNHPAAVEPHLDVLLRDPDLRRRGLAFYLAVEHRGAAGIEAVAPYLNHEAQLLRFDAYSALKLSGGEAAVPILAEYKKREKHPRLRRMFEPKPKPSLELEEGEGDDDGDGDNEGDE